MEIKVDRKILVDAIAEVATFSPNKAPMAILKNVKITTNGNRMKLECNDTQNAITKIINLLECDSNGEFLVDVQSFGKFIAATKGDSLTIIVDDAMVTVKHSKGKADFVTSASAEFPSFKMDMTDVKEFTIPAAFLFNCVNNGKSFVASDTLRPQMCAIYAYIKDGIFGYCATDTNKLVHGHMSDAINNSDINWYIMPSTFSSIMKGCKNGGEVIIQVSSTKVSYNFGDTMIHSVMTNGRYPDFNRVIPKQWNMECAIDKDEFMDSLKRVSMFCNNSRCVKMNISRMDMSLSVDNIEDGKSSVESLVHNGCNGELEVGFNADYLNQIISVFGSGEVMLCLSEANRPMVVKQVEKQNFVAILMPMSIAN